MSCLTSFECLFTVLYREAFEWCRFLYYYGYNWVKESGRESLWKLRMLSERKFLKNLREETRELLVDAHRRFSFQLLNFALHSTIMFKRVHWNQGIKVLDTDAINDVLCRENDDILSNPNNQIYLSRGNSSKIHVCSTLR